MTNLSSFSHRASGTNIAAIDNKIEQAMVSSPHAFIRHLHEKIHNIHKAVLFLN